MDIGGYYTRESGKKQPDQKISFIKYWTNPPG